MHPIPTPSQYVSRSSSELQSFNPAARPTLSPSTRTHHPSPPCPPSPPTAALNSFFANSKISSSKVPGCNQTPWMPSFFASSSTFFVTFGGVIMDTDVSVGCGSAERLGKVGYSLISRSGHGGYALMVGAEGLMGVAGMEWWVYQVNTGQLLMSVKRVEDPQVSVGDPRRLALIVERKSCQIWHGCFNSSRMTYFYDRTWLDHCLRQQRRNTAPKRRLWQRFL